MDQNMIDSVGGPVASGVAGLFGGTMLRDLISWLRGSRRDKAEVDKLKADVMEVYIRTLIDGYEARVKDLTAEIHALRDEVRSLRDLLDATRANAPGAL